MCMPCPTLHTVGLGIGVMLAAPIVAACTIPSYSRGDASATRVPVVAASDAPVQPMASQNSTIAPESPLIALESKPTETTWIRHTSQLGGYLFSYPAGWQVIDHDHGTTELIPPDGRRENKIGFGYIQFEKDAAEDLLVWLERYYALDLGPSTNRQIAPSLLNLSGAGEHFQQAFVDFLPPSAGEGYAVSQGRLVLMIATPSDENLTVLKSVVESFEFTDHAPVYLQDLFVGEPPPSYLTIEQWEQSQRASLTALDALNECAQTGIISEETFAALSVEARELFEEMLILHAAEIERLGFNPANCSRRGAVE